MQSSAGHELPAVPDAQALRQYASWFARYEAVCGPRGHAELAEALSRCAGEAAQSGIDTPERLFLYVTARLLMPDMMAPRYLLTMDIVFDAVPEGEKVERIVELSEVSEESVLEAARR